MITDGRGKGLSGGGDGKIGGIVEPERRRLACPPTAPESIEIPRDRGEDPIPDATPVERATDALKSPTEEGSPWSFDERDLGRERREDVRDRGCCTFCGPSFLPSGGLRVRTTIRTRIGAGVRFPISGAATAASATF
jgi:hypothetical protein